MFGVGVSERWRRSVFDVIPGVDRAGPGKESRHNGHHHPPLLDLTDGVGAHCRCRDGSLSCIRFLLLQYPSLKIIAGCRDERLQCRKTLEVLAGSEAMQNIERQQRHHRRNIRRRLKRMFRKWMAGELEREERTKM